MNIYNIKFKILPALWTFLLMGLWIVPPSHGLEIKVKERAVVRGDRVTLGDIASFDPDKDSRVARLRKIAIASAPSPGNSISLNARFLSYKIGSAVAGNDDIRIKAPAKLIVQRAAQYVDEDLLEEIFKDYIKSNLPWPADRIEFERIITPKNIALPEGEMHWELRERGGSNYAGNRSIVVNFFVDGIKVRTVSISGRIRVWQEIVKAAKKIKKGRLISRDDLVLVVESHTRLRKDVLTDLNEAIGKRSVNGIGSGRLITSRMIEDPPLVKKGDRVIIKAENKQIRITTIGRVLEDGRSGDQVRVVNISSGKEVFATVMGPKLVEVTF